MSQINNQKIIALLLYPGFTALDLVGPHHIFSVLDGYEVHLVWKTKELVTSDTGLSIQPTLTIDECPEELAVLFVPGGTSGTVEMMQDEEILSWLRSRRPNYITSVCTGALILGAAGLLQGYKATTHWIALDLLKTLGAEPVANRIVEDRNRFTGGGVTAGIDFGLALAAKLKDERYAQWVQLVMEYSPQPPFQSGSPNEASEELTTMSRQMFEPFLQAAAAAASSDG
ncbi:MAG: DJ-1/PfpI family protein [Cyanobacteria bacterium P01_H01_bin.105]